MPSLRFRLPKPVIEAPDWSALRAELRIDEAISADALAVAQASALKPLPDVEDLRDLPFFTLDPAGSKDLDQAMYLQRSLDGYLVHYGIADVAHFVAPGDAMDLRAQTQGQTFYGPDKQVPLYPFVISEGAGSLLPAEDRPCVLWTIALDSIGEITSIDTRRALVHSQTQLAYDNLDGADEEQLEILREIGERRHALERQRNAVDLPSPEQVVVEGSSGPALRYRATTPLEMWNSQISLLTGMAAAKLMIDARVGLLRTLPQADPKAINSLRLSAKALDIDWPDGASYGDVVSAIDIQKPNALAFLNLAARLLRGAGYVSFDGSLPANTMHSGVGAPYAHCTAPLRRLADRYVNEICIALCAKTSTPDWVLADLHKLPKVMGSSDQKSHALDRAIIETTEAYVMSSFVGKSFDAEVVEKFDGEKHGSVLVQLSEPAVRAQCEIGDHAVNLGSRAKVKCIEADALSRNVRFKYVSPL